MTSVDQKNPEEASTISLIYTLMGIDEELEARLNLIKRLGTLVKLAIDSRIGNDQLWQQWATALEDDEKSLLKDGWLTVQNDSKTNNPINIRASTARIPAALCQGIIGPLGQYLGLLVLLLNAIADNKSAHLTHFADEVRLASETKKHRFDLLKTFPSIYDTENGYLTKLEIAITKQREKQLSILENNFISAVEKLLEIAKNCQKAKPPIVAPPQSPSPGGDNQWVEGSVIHFDPSDRKENGSIYQFPTEFDVYGEPEQPHWGYVPPPPDGEEEEASDEQQNAEARRSRYWLRNAANRTINDETILSPIEKLVLTKYFHEHLGLHPTSANSSTALLIGLMYATGFSLEELLAIEVSDSGIITPNGIYRRQIPQTSEGYTPPDEAQIAYIFNTIELPLPNILRNWFFANHSKFTANRSLGEILSLSKEEALRSMKTALKALRNSGRFRIKLPRIEAGLRAELSARIQNPAITYLLACSKDQELPTLIYYQQLSPTALQSAYEEAIKYMFPAGSENG